jgi:hypothetical protein
MRLKYLLLFLYLKSSFIVTLNNDVDLSKIVFIVMNYQNNRNHLRIAEETKQNLIDKLKVSCRFNLLSCQYNLDHQ